MNDTVQLKVNEQELVRKLSLAFSREDIFLAELMQNARRAGASRIDFYYDGENLIVIDDGDGIDNLQDILSVAQSGWNQQIQEEEGPYGMGFLSAIYQAEEVEIQSRGQAIQFRTEDALQFKSIPVRSIPDDGKTRIRLENPPGINYGHLLARYAMAFPVAVYYNGKLQENPYSLANTAKNWQETPMGQMHIVEYDGDDLKRQYGSKSIIMVLQGFVVYTSSHFDMVRTGMTYSNILHLDPRRYQGRLPDRDKLIDEQRVVNEADAMLTRIWRLRIQELCAKADDATIAGEWYNALRYWGSLDQLNTVNLLPYQVLVQRTDYPEQVQEWEDEYSGYGKLLSREELETGTTTLWKEVDPPYSEEDSWHTAMYIYLKQLVLLKGDLHEEHWVHELVKNLGYEDVQVRTEGRQKEATYGGNWFDAHCIMAEKIWLDGPVGSIACSEAFLYVPPPREGCDGNYIWDGPGTVYIPESETDGTVVTQISMFNSDDQYQEVEEDMEREQFERFLLELKPGNELRLVREVMQKSGIHRYDSLNGKTFSVTIRDGDLEIKMTT